MREYIRPVDQGFAMTLVRRWDYPREVDPIEVRCSKFYVLKVEDNKTGTITNDLIGVAWFHVMVPPAPITSYAIHVCVDPIRRATSMVGTPEMMAQLCTLAQLQGGCQRLYSPVAKDSAPRSTARVMARYLRARGWREDEFGAYTDLGIEC